LCTTKITNYYNNTSIKKKKIQSVNIYSSFKYSNLNFHLTACLPARLPACFLTAWPSFHATTKSPVRRTFQQMCASALYPSFYLLVITLKPCPYFSINFPYHLDPLLHRTYYYNYVEKTHAQANP